jgi:hypothetical protein
MSVVGVVQQCARQVASALDVKSHFCSYREDQRLDGERRREMEVIVEVRDVIINVYAYG